MKIPYTVSWLELWRPIVGYEGVYEVSNAGRIRSFRVDKDEGRLLTPGLSQTGYLSVVLYKDGRHRTMNVHTAVIEAFRGPRPLKHETNHKNGVKTDNDIRNLEYLSASDHRRYAYRVGQAHPSTTPRQENGRWIPAPSAP